MSKKVKIVADTASDLGRELYEKYDIDLVAMNIRLGENEYEDGENFSPDSIYEFYDQTGKLPTTSCPNVSTYVDTFQKWTAQGYEVVSISISSGFSASYHNSELAAEEVPGVYTVDSRNLSTGSGLLVLEAAEMAQQGMEAKDIAEKLRELTANVRASFILDNLLYLWKGGRCSGVAALGANLLKLKPCIEVVDGKMNVGKKYRGALGACLRNYVNDKLANNPNVDTKRIFITHSGMTDPSLIDEVKKEVEKLQKFDEILITRAGCTVSSHCGSNTLGILYMVK